MMTLFITSRNVMFKFANLTLFITETAFSPVNVTDKHMVDKLSNYSFANY